LWNRRRVTLDADAQAFDDGGFLVMFDSPVEAVRCAIVIQQSVMGRNTSLPREQWILYRIGVHLGDVIVETSDVYGEGVNVAARLEGIATPGDLYISGGVYEQIKNKLVCAYQSLGDRQVKNITDPVSVYRVLPDPAALNEARKKRWPAPWRELRLVEGQGDDPRADVIGDTVPHPIRPRTAIVQRLWPASLILIVPTIERRSRDPDLP
jgi:Adenylate and Guanylate cyclase catalytic domain